MYRKARDSWAQLANTAKGAYVADITIGEEPQQRGIGLIEFPLWIGISKPYPKSWHLFR
jgi:hypothetical protein